MGCKIEKAVEERPVVDPPAIAVGGAAVFLLDHMTSEARDGCQDELCSVCRGCVVDEGL